MIKHSCHEIWIGLKPVLVNTLANNIVMEEEADHEHSNSYLGVFPEA
jgi:hypothetical protein